MKLFYLSLLTLTVGYAMKSAATTSHTMAQPTNPITVNDKQFAVSIPHEKIDARVKALADQISQDYAGKKPILIGVLNGAFIFLSDLVKELSIECEIDFIKLSSYGDATTSSGTITLSKDLSLKITDRDIIIVEDIVDTGLSIQFARDHLLKHNPRSVRIATALHKDIANLDFAIDYVGFHIKPDFVLGYGLDYAQVGRNLKDIYTLV